MSFINAIIEHISNFLYMYVLIALLLSAGIWFSIKSKFVQIRLFPDAVKSLTEKKHGKATSSFQALMISTAARVGIGNIAGVANAIVLGGPGAVFWMWIMAMLGSASAFIECTLAQIYKVKDGSQFRGGPAYYIERVLKKRWLGILFAIFLILCFAYGFNALQSFMISSSMKEYIPNYENSIFPIIIGISLAIITSLVIFGGIHRIGFISAYIVPVMAFGYIGMGLAIMIINIGKVPEMFYIIFKNALDIKSIFGGVGGFAILEGVKKGLLANEAGMGSAANAAASADVTHPVKQGVGQVFSVFISTFLICTTTAFIVLLSGITLDGKIIDTPLVQQAIITQIGPIGNIFLTLAIFFFAFSSIIGNYSYAESNILFIKNSKILLNIFRVTCIAVIILGCISSSKTVWGIADIFMALMTIVNIIAIFLIGNKAIICLKDYVKQKKEGKDPVFNAPKAGINDTDLWK